MRHRNINTEEWSRMAIDSLFERGVLPDWREFAQALQRDVNLASETLLMCERHPDKASAALARTLAEHFHPELTLRR
jgi:hypothetical protein